MQRKQRSDAIVRLTAGIVLAAAAAIASGPALAASEAKIHGKSYGQWSVGWWQWQEANFPDFAFGDGLVDCALGQSGPVWYLGGTGGGFAERTCAEPLGKHTHLFIPLVNASIFNEDPLCPDNFCTVEEKREILDGLFSENPPGVFESVACDLQIEVDGTPAVYSTPIVRVQSPTFSYADDDETVSDGVWVMLDALSRGDHVIHFTGGICDVDTGESLFNVDVIYNLTVR